MRKWLKIGLISSSLVLISSAALALSAKIIYDIKNDNSNVVSKPENKPTDTETTPPPNINDNDSNNDGSKPDDKPIEPEHPEEKPPIIEEDKDENKPEEIIPPSKPEPPNFDEIEDDTINKEKQISLEKYLNGYIILQKTTKYDVFWNNNKQLLFDELLIYNNIFPIIKDAIMKTNTYNPEIMTIKYKVHYYLNKNNTSVNFWIQWSTKLKDINFDVIKQYYDKITINLNKA